MLAELGTIQMVLLTQRMLGLIGWNEIRKHRIHVLCLTAFSPWLLLSPLSSSISVSFCQLVHSSRRAYCVPHLALSASESVMNTTLSQNPSLENHTSRACMRTVGAQQAHPWVMPPLFSSVGGHHLHPAERADRAQHPAGGLLRAEAEAHEVG